jgi:Holliday junction resolvase RusA-like endonuclease
MDSLVVQFTVPGMPQGKARPRVSLKTGRAYTPKKTVSYENLVQFVAIQQLPRGFVPFEGPFRVDITAWYQRPKSHYGTGKNAGKLKKRFEHVWPKTVPDVDNVAKAICDSLNGIVWRDDAQVVILNVSKFYEQTDSGGPRVEVVIEQMKEGR